MAPRGGAADRMTGGGRSGGAVLDVALDFRPVHGSSVVIRHGGKAVFARVSWLGGRFHQVRCAAPLAARSGDRLEIHGPEGGVRGTAVVLDPAAERHGPDNDVLVRLARIERGERNQMDAPPPLDDAALALEERYRAAGGHPPADKDLDAVDRAALFALREAGLVVRLRKGMHVHTAHVE